MRQMDLLTTAQAARVAGIDPRNAGVMVPQLARTLDGDTTDPRIVRVRWPAGTVLAMAVVRALDPHGTNTRRWAAGARGVSEAQERGLCPAYLVTAGGTDYGIVLDADGAERAAVELAGHVAAEGRVARIVRVTPIVEDLCDVLELRALA
jgi:hypothetical protein